MIAPQRSQSAVRFAPVNERREYSPDEAREILRSVMTEKFRRWLMKKALQMTDGDWQRSQDLVQDVFLVMLKCQSYDPNRCSPSHFAIWKMHKILCTLPPVGSRLKAGSLVSDPVSRPLTMATETKEVVQMMQQAISQLPEREYAVIVQRMDGMKLPEIAVQSGITRQRVSQIEQNAMSRLAGFPLPVSA